MLIKNRYKLVSTLSESAYSTVWIANDKKRVTSQYKNSEVVVKMYNKNYMTSDIDNIIKFKKVLKILSESNIKETAKILDTGEVDNNFYIVMERVCGNSLDKYFDEPLQRKIDIFLNIVYAISNIHNLGIVHKDLKSQNILVDDNNLDVHIIDFDFSCVLKDDVKKNKFEGSIKYASPEQIGVIRSDIDKRSDLYSLGVILYELLTNRLPIDGENLNEFSYNLISKRPKNPIEYNNKLDETISKIALKLLEKDPKQRYLSTKGLIHDLEKYKQGYRNFDLGLFDDGINLKYVTKLIGREHELTKITNIFFNLDTKGGKFVFIEGKQGVGKNRLLDEFRDNIIRRNTMIINAKNMFMSNDGDYETIKNIVLLIVKRIKSLSLEEQNYIKTTLIENMGEDIGIIANISPIVERIVGKFSSKVKVDKDKTKREFLAIETFLSLVSTIKKSLIIFMGDFRTLDSMSKEFFVYLSERISKYKILIFWTSKGSVKDFDNNDVIKIELSNLDKNDTNELVSEVLTYDSSKLERITDIIYKKSRGNPRYSLKILKSLIGQKTLVRKDGKWIYQDSKKDDLKNSLLDVQIRDILDMEDNELYVLTIFASIGKYVDVDVLADVLNRKLDDVFRMIKKFYELKLIENDDGNSNQYSFFSEKVRQVLVSRVKDENERILHERIGEVLEKKYKDNREYILDIYEHFKKANNVDKMEEYAKKVKDFDIYNLDSKLALDCFCDVLKIKDDCEYKRMVAKIHYMLGDLDISAKIFEELYDIVATKEKKLDVLINLINIYNKKQNYTRCEEYIKTALNILNIHIPKSDIIIWFKYINELTKIFYSKKESSEDIKIALYIALASYYKGKDELKSRYFANKQYNLMKQVGKNKGIKIDAINAFHEYCRNNSTRILDITIEEEKDLKNRYQIAYTYKLYGEYYERKGDYKAAIDKYTKSANLYKSINNDFCYYNIQSRIFDNDYRLSLYKNAINLNYDYSNFVNENYKDYNIKAYSNFLKIYIAYSDTKNMEEYKERIKDFIRNNNDIETPLYIDALKTLGILELEYGTVESAIDYFKNIVFLHKDDTSIYLYLAEAYIEQLLSNDKVYMMDKNIIIVEVNKFLRKVRKKCNRSQRGRYYYQKARLYAFRGKDEIANMCYNMSIRILEKIDDKYAIARVYLDYAKLLRKNGDRERSDNYLEKAYVIFCDIGANKYSNKIRKYFYDNFEEHEKKDLLRKVNYANSLEIIIKMNQYISSMLKTEDLLDKVLKMAVRAIGAQGGCIFIKNNYTHDMEKKASFFIGDEVYSNNIIYVLQKTLKPILTIDASEDERFIDNRSIILNDIRSVMAVPIKYGDVLKGICYLSNTLSSGVFDERDLELIELIMNQLAISLENSELYTMAITDGLTGLINNKHFRYILGNELKRCYRHGRTLSIGMLDIDHFKKFNDTYGHQAGDYVLSKVADIMKNTFRKSDFVARYGGEEFIVLLPETDIEGAYIVCERLRDTIEKSEFIFGKDKFSVRVSMGVAEYIKHGKASDEIIKSADTALYKSKENGRNRVTKAE